jgi:hypothetical protein
VPATDHTSQESHVKLYPVLRQHLQPVNPMSVVFETSCVHWRMARARVHIDDDADAMLFHLRWAGPGPDRL